MSIAHVNINTSSSYHLIGNIYTKTRGWRQGRGKQFLALPITLSSFHEHVKFIYVAMVSSTLMPISCLNTMIDVDDDGVGDD